MIQEKCRLMKFRSKKRERERKKEEKRIKEFTQEIRWEFINWKFSTCG